MSIADSMHRHGLIPFVQIDPTLASVSAIASGSYDGYLRQYADSVHDYGHAVVIGFGHEMNATWYSWGYRRTSPSTFVAAWRHIVTLFREQGADNVTWLWTIQADQPGTGPILSWWPGAKYVTWVGHRRLLPPSRPTRFNSVFVPTIDQVRTFTPKPILLSETAVARHANQYTNILNLFHGMTQYRTLGLVWFDKDQTQQAVPQGDPADVRLDWRIEDNPLAEAGVPAGRIRADPGVGRLDPDCSSAAAAELHMRATPRGDWAPSSGNSPIALALAERDCRFLEAVFLPGGYRHGT